MNQVTIKIVETALKEFEVVVDTGEASYVAASNWNYQNAAALSGNVEREWKDLGFTVIRA